MANPEHVRRAGYAIANWNRWRDENPDVVPDLSGADLQKADLSHADLTGARLKATQLAKTDLPSATGLTQAQVDEALGDNTTKLPAGIGRPSSWGTSNS